MEKIPPQFFVAFLIFFFVFVFSSFFCTISGSVCFLRCIAARPQNLRLKFLRNFCTKNSRCRLWAARTSRSAKSPRARSRTETPNAPKFLPPRRAQSHFLGPLFCLALAENVVPQRANPESNSPGGVPPRTQQQQAAPSPFPTQKIHPRSGLRHESPHKESVCSL